jgi:hypothetical protein
MSLSLSVLLVDPALPRRAIGSRDDDLHRAVSARYEGDLAFLDEQFSFEIEDGAPAGADALRAVIDGGPFVEDWDRTFPYGYAFQIICRHFGSYLFNNHFSPYRGEWLETVDEGLTALGVTAVRLTDFGYGSLPTPLPYCETPGYGEWSNDQCRAGLEQWEASTAVQRSGLGDQVLEAITSCADWMRAATADAALGVVAFRA